MTRKCSQCGAVYPIEDYHKNSCGKDGRTGACKFCLNAKRRGTDTRRRTGRKKSGYTVKDKINRQVSRAVQCGDIEKPSTCLLCLRSDCRIVGHHEDYSLPMAVVWLCDSCHRNVHAGNISLLPELMPERC